MRNLRNLPSSHRHTRSVHLSFLQQGFDKDLTKESKKMEVQTGTTRRRTSTRSPNKSDILQSDEKYNVTSSQDAPVKRWSEDDKIMPLKKRKILKTICEEDGKEDDKSPMKKRKSYVDQCHKEKNKETRSSMELFLREEVPEVDTETKLKQTPTYNSSGQGNDDGFSVDQIIDDVLLSIQRDFNSNPQNKFKEEETPNDIKIEEKLSRTGVVSGSRARMRLTEECSPFIKEEKKFLLRNEPQDDTGFMIRTSPTLGTNAEERFFEEVKEKSVDEAIKLGGTTMELFEAEEDFELDLNKPINWGQIEETAFNQQCYEVPINDDVIVKAYEEDQPILILDSEEEEALKRLRNIPKRKRSNRRRRRRNPNFVSRCLSAANLDNEHEGLLEKTRQFDDLYSRVKKGCRSARSQNHSKCNQVSRRGWKCNNNVKKPFSLCAYHLEKQELECRREEKIKCNHSEQESAGPKAAEKSEMQSPKLPKIRSIKCLFDQTVPTQPPQLPR